MTKEIASLIRQHLKEWRVVLASTMTAITICALILAAVYAVLIMTGKIKL